MNKIKKMVFVILLVALLCSCTKNEQNESITQSTAQSTQSDIYNASSENVVSSSTESEEDSFPVINKYHYTPLGYADCNQRYLVLSEQKNNERDIYYIYYIYDELEDRVVNCFTCYDRSVGFCDGTLTFTYYQYENDDTDKYRVYYEVTDIFGGSVKAKEEVAISSEDYTYCPSEDALYFVIDEFSDDGSNGFYKTDAFGNTVRLAQYTPSGFYVTDDEIVCYYIEKATPGKSKACYFVVMDKSGNELRKVNIGSFSSARRLMIAGDYICFMSPLETERDVIKSEASNGVIFYNHKQNEMRVQYFDERIENSYCAVTPDGKHFITCVPHDIKVTDVAIPYYKREDTVINIYDVATGEKLVSENLGIDNLHTTKFDAFNEGVSIIGHSRFFYKLKQ